jgi:hypothetical protein
VNSRPYEGLLVCLPVAFALLWWVCKRQSPSWRITLPRVVLPVSAMLLLTAVSCGYYNWRVTENPFLFPHTLFELQYETVRSFVWQSPLPPMHYNNKQFETAYTTQNRNTYRHTWTDYQTLVERKIHDLFLFYIGPPLLVPFIAIPLLFTNRRMRFLLWPLALYCAGSLIVIWSQPHYAAPVLGVFVVLFTNLFRYLRRWTYLGRPVGVGITRVLILFSAAAIPILAVVMTIDPQGFAGSLWGHSNWDRARVANELSSIPGPQLVIVRYSPTHHNVGLEWVYNAADIDHSHVAWAREIPGIDNQPLLDYYKDRRVWVVEPDVKPIVLQPYAPPTSNGPPQP